MSEVTTDLEKVADTPLPDETQSTASAAPAAEQFSEAPATPENDEQKNAKVKDGVQKRIDELTYRANQAQREKQIAEDYAKAVEANLLQQKRELAQYQAYATAPRVDQFNSVEEWQAAVMRHATDTANHQVQSTLQQLGMTPEQQIQRAQQEQYNQFTQSRVAEATQKYPDFSEKVNNPQLPDLTRVNPAVLQALVASPNFADIAYHLASNPQEAWRIAQSHPAQAVMELGTLAARITASGPRVSNAPAPDREIGSSESVKKDPAQMSYSEYRAWRTKKR